ncbi:hypothetical protein GUJ93_ZPchr0009g642 [Zizania palustris]|uniref:Uncharacterized protein n=1 Tax=Zizania palustris TaxID=103762 RepID=A0A8J5RYB5_ZIZPA|nr:hypothetical protein GUJ93_ZPchr0009g642 [Zizania palustris]
MEPKGLVPMIAEAVEVEGEATEVVALPLGSPGDSGVESLWMFLYVGGGSFEGEAARICNHLVDSKEKALNLEDALQQEQGRWAAFEVEAENLQAERVALVAEV